MGKSALVTNIAENAAIDHGKPVALFSLEMSETELAQRFIASQAKLSSDELRKGQVKRRPLAQGAEGREKLASAPLYIDDSSDIGILEMRAKARRLHASTALGLLIVDYLQLMRADTARRQPRRAGRPDQPRAEDPRPRAGDPGDRGVAALARGRVARKPPEPMLSDLRESGQIEQDADVVMFIYRDEYYNDESERTGRGRRDRRQAPQRADRRRRAHLPRPAIRSFANLYRDRSARRGRAARTAPADVLRPVTGRARSPTPQAAASASATAAAGCSTRRRTPRALRCRAAADRGIVRPRCGGGIPKRFRGVSLRPPADLRPGADASCATCAASSREIEHNLDAGRGLWFYGDVGTGKTSLAMLVSKAALEAGRSVAIYSVPHLLAEIRDTYDGDSSDAPTLALFSRLCDGRPARTWTTSAPSSQTEWVLEQLYSIVNERWQDAALDRRHDQRARSLPRRDPGHAPRRDRRAAPQAPERGRPGRPRGRDRAARASGRTARGERALERRGPAHVAAPADRLAHGLAADRDLRRPAPIMGSDLRMQQGA